MGDSPTEAGAPATCDRTAWERRQLRALREILCLEIEEIALADPTLSADTVRGIEDGSRMLELPDIVRLCNIYRVPTHIVLGETAVEDLVDEGNAVAHRRTLPI